MFRGLIYKLEYKYNRSSGYYHDILHCGFLLYNINHMNVKVIKYCLIFVSRGGRSNHNQAKTQLCLNSGYRSPFVFTIERSNTPLIRTANVEEYNIHRNQIMLSNRCRPHGSGCDRSSYSGHWSLLMLLMSLTITHPAISILVLLTLPPLHAPWPSRPNALAVRNQDCQVRVTVETVCQWPVQLIWY